MNARPRHHRLSYGVFSLLVDLDDLQEMTRHLKWLSYNRRSFYAIHDKDHGDGQVYDHGSLQSSPSWPGKSGAQGHHAVLSAHIGLCLQPTDCFLLL